MTWLIIIGIGLLLLELHNCYRLLEKIHSESQRQRVLLEAIKAETTNELNWYRPQAVRIFTDKEEQPAEG